MNKKKKKITPKDQKKIDLTVQKQKKKIRSFSILFFILTLLVTPNVYFEQTMDPTLIPRFTTLAIILLVFQLYFISRKEVRNVIFNNLKRPIIITFFAFFCISAISLFSAHIASEGIYDVLKAFLMLILLILSSALLLSNEENLLEIIIKIVVINTLIVGLITLYDLIDSLSKIEKWWSFAAEVKGLMANKNQLSIALFLLLPFNIYSLMRSKNIWKIIAIINILLLFGEIVILRTRSVWMALTVSTFIFGGMYLILSKLFVEKINVKLRLAIIAGIIVIVGSTIVFISYSDSKIATYVKTSASSINKINEDFSRYKVWKGTLEMSKDNPLLGVGAGNWKIHMADYYKLGENEEFQNWRRPHNDFLWALAEKGILGLITFVAIFAFTLLIAYKIIKSKKIDKKRKLLSLILGSFFIGYIICSFLTFPYERMNHQIYIASIIAILISIFYTTIPENKKVTQSKLRFAFPLITSIVLLFSIYYGSVAFNMETNLKKCIGNKNAQQWNYVIHYANQGYHPLTKLAPSSAPIYWYRGLGHYMTKNYKQALEDFKFSYDLQPNHPYVMAYYASLEGYFGNNKLAIDLLKHTLKNYPNYEDALVNIFAAYYKLKQFDSANYYLQQCDPKSTNKYVSQYNKAIEQTFVNIAAAYYNKQQFDSAYIYIEKCDIHSENKDVRKYRDLIEEKMNELR